MKTIKEILLELSFKSQSGVGVNKPKPAKIEQPDIPNLSRRNFLKASGALALAAAPHIVPKILQPNQQNIQHRPDKINQLIHGNQNVKDLIRAGHEASDKVLKHSPNIIKNTTIGKDISKINSKIGSLIKSDEKRKIP